MANPWDELGPREPEVGSLSSLGSRGMYADVPVEPIDWERAKRRALTAVINAAQMGSFNALDELAGYAEGAVGYLQGKPFWETADKGTERLRGIERAASEAEPDAASLGSLLGIAIPGGYAKIGGLEKLLSPLLKGRKAVTRGIGRTVESAAYGGLYNTIAAYGGGEGDKRTEGLLPAFLEGAGVGAIGGVATAGTRAFRKAVDILKRGDQIPKGLRDVFMNPEQRFDQGLPIWRRSRGETAPPQVDVPAPVKLAAELEARGFHPDHVSRLTGLERHDDGKWRPTLGGSLAQ